jgi:MbtH protein
MTNPFEDENGTYLALVNEEGQYSLWPNSVEIPSGWAIAHGPDKRTACLDHIEASWTDMRPKSLIRAMQQADAAKTRSH